MSMYGLKQMFSLEMYVLTFQFFLGLLKAHISM